MNDDVGKKRAPSTEKTGEFFNVGAPLHAVRPGYIRRPADDELFNTLVAGHYAHVIAPDRTGKTSLIASTAARLQNNGYKVAVLDLAQISERDGGSDAGRWYYSIAYRLSRQLRLKTDLQMWWQDHSILSNRQRLVEFYVQVVLKNVDENIVVFIDGVEFVANLPFTEHLLASIRAAHNSRVTEPEFNRLGFVTIGECDPHSLGGDSQLSPFAVSTQILLGDFSREDLNVFAPELDLSSASAVQALDRVYYWTNGHPYLSQKLCRTIARANIAGDVDEVIDKFATRQLAGRLAVSSEPHLSHLQRAVLDDKKHYESLLTLYGRIRKGITVACDMDSALHRQLLAIGLVVTNAEQNFEIRNRIYEIVFTARWANENLPLHWRGPAIAAAMFLVLTAIPFAYTQLLPKPYLRVMANTSYDLETVADAYQNLRSFPGHDDAADRMYGSVLQSRARNADNPNDIREVAQYSNLLPDGAQLADALTASFWDRETAAAMREERRDDAILASLEALAVSGDTRRGRTATLIGDDYAQLLATIPGVPADGVVFDAVDGLLTYHRGAEIRQWSIAENSIEPREPWTMLALEVSPLVRRLIVDRDGAAARIGLSVNVSHPRLDDLRIRLIAPSGRAAELNLLQTSSAANEEIRIPAEQLRSLNGESLNGTWSLSVRDEASGVSGHLVGWKLSLNSQVAVESFARGLDVPDPSERATENLWFSPQGRFAIARARQSDSAQIWDLSYANATRAIAVPASETVVGLSSNAEFLVTIAQNTVNLWRTSDGRRHAELDVQAAGGDILLSADGAHLLVTSRGAADTTFSVWSIRAGTKLGDLSIAGVPALISIDNSASFLAVADFDRAVRVWNLRSGDLLNQIDVAAQPSDIKLSANGQVLGVISAQMGVSLWHVLRSAEPIFAETGNDEWHMEFSPSGARFIAGNLREGMQVYRSSDGAPSGPLLDPGLPYAAKKLFRFNADESQVVTAGLNDIARVWSVPPSAVTTTGVATLVGEDTVDLPQPGEEMVTVSTVAPGARRIAVGDRSGHVHIHRIDSSARNVVTDEEDISFVGHRGTVLSVAFSTDGDLIASAGADGTIRIWDGHSGSPRPFYGRAETTGTVRLRFSPTAAALAVLNGQRVWLISTEDGTEIASIELGEAHSDLAFADDKQIFLAADSGALRNMYADRTGNWHLRSVWQGPQPLRQIAIAPKRGLIVLVDALGEARSLNLRDGKLSAAALNLPSAVSNMVFSPNEAYILFRTGRWIHRALNSPGGPIWTGSLRAPKAIGGSQMVFESDDRAASRDGEEVLLLTNVTGQMEIVELGFDYTAAPAIFGTRANLLSEWTDKLRGQATSDFVREGF